MKYSHIYLLISLGLIACGGGQPPAQSPATADSSTSATPEPDSRPPSLAEEQQASMREYAQQVAEAKTQLDAALEKSDCSASCKAIHAMAKATNLLCRTVLTEDDQKQCKALKVQFASERERSEKTCAPCPSSKKAHKED